MMKNFFAIIVFLFCASFLFAGGKKDKPSKEEENPVTEEVKETLQEKSARILKENNGAAYTRDEIEGEVLEFDEVWGFALQERPDELDFDVPVTDIAVFTTTLTIYGELTDIPKSTLLSSFSGRKHLVFACDSRALMHFVLDPSFGIRKKVSSDLINACKNYDGLCIDLEYLPARDRGNFFSFLRDMKKMLNGKILSVCVPARTRTISD
ncbi:MAG: hypothetical protein IKI31_03485, partial [Treponema sp.]|nr:hypothetical protein [Treponema sp.]